nr:MAG TPA: hypothetical protein [Caudoviricetes sp.]
MTRISSIPLALEYRGVLRLHGACSVLQGHR